MLAGKVGQMYTLAKPVGTIKHNWQAIWLVPGVMATIVLVLFAIFFKEPARKEGAVMVVQG